MKISGKRHYSMRFHFFLKSFFRHFILLMIVVSAIGPYAIFRSVKAVEKTTKQNNLNLLYRIEETMGNLFQVIDNASLYFAKNPSVIVKLKNAFHENSLSLDSINSMQTITLFLQNMVNTDEFIYSAYVYYENDNDRFLTSEYGLTNADIYFDTSWLTSYYQSKENFWYQICEIKPHKFSAPTTTLTIFKKIYSPLSPKKSNGVIVVQIILETLQDYIATLSLYPNQIISFIKDDGTVLFKNTSDDITDAWQLTKQQELNDDELIAFPINYKETRYVASILNPERNDSWSYLSLVPFNDLYHESIALLAIVLLLTAASFLLSMFIAMYSANKDYKRLETIMDMLNNADNYNYVYCTYTIRVINLILGFEKIF